MEFVIHVQTAFVAHAATKVLRRCYACQRPASTNVALYLSVCKVTAENADDIWLL